MYATKCGVCGESLEVCLDLLVAGQKAWLEFVFVQYFILRYAWRTTMEDDYQEVIYKYIKYIISVTSIVSMLPVWVLLLQINLIFSAPMVSF